MLASLRTRSEHYLISLRAMALVRLSPETGSLMVRTSFFFPGSVLIGVTIELGFACLATREGELAAGFAGNASDGRGLLGAGALGVSGLGATGKELSAGFGFSGAFGTEIALGVREGEGDLSGLGCTRDLESESTFLGLFGVGLELRVWSEGFLVAGEGEVDCLLPSRGIGVGLEAMGGNEGKEGIESPLGPTGAGGPGIIEEKPGMSMTPLGNT